MKNLLLITLTTFFLFSCSDNDDGSFVDDTVIDNGNGTGDNNTNPSGIDLSEYFSIDFDNLPNYANQEIPNYITKDNTTNNPITDQGATLGRILFYDKNLSTDNTVSCASCHQQANAFSDLNLVSQGVNGVTGRHSMRLVNSRFADESNFFWDERAGSLEQQTTMPIQDHNEMGFSGENGDPGMEDLLVKMGNIDYYPELFEWVYGDNTITEVRMQNALAQFIRSIQSFDSKYDTGRAVANDNQPFPNFTQEENQGKMLFMTPANFDNTGNRVSGGIGCNTCHNAPEFDIDPDSRNIGLTEIINSTEQDLTVTRVPSLRDLFKQNGESNGPMMHSGISSELDAVLAHYNTIPADNPQLDPRLRPNGNLQRLQMTQQEIASVTAFLKTLSGSDMYTNIKWSDPFVN